MLNTFTTGESDLIRLAFSKKGLYILQGKGIFHGSIYHKSLEYERADQTRYFFFIFFFFRYA